MAFGVETIKGKFKEGSAGLMREILENEALSVVENRLMRNGVGRGKNFRVSRRYQIFTISDFYGAKCGKSSNFTSNKRDIIV